MCRCHCRCCQTEEIQLGPAFGLRTRKHAYISNRCCRRCHFIISLFRYASFVCSCSCVRMFTFLCLQNGASILRKRQRRQRDTNIFNSKQHFSVKFQLIDFFRSLSLSLWVWAINNRTECVEKTSNAKKAFRIKAFL